MFIVLCVSLEMLLVWGGALSRGPGPHILPLQLVWKVLKQSTESLVFGKVL